MADIFLSYNREDQAVARRYAEAFEAEGFSVWWDVGLKSGQHYDQVTEQALRGARAVVVLWSPRSVASNWVRSEADLGKENDRYVPVKIEACDLPVMFRLVQTPDLSRWKGDRRDAGWLALLEVVRTHTAKEAPAGAAAIPAAKPAAAGGPSRRTMLVAGGAAGAVVLAGGAWALWPKGASKRAGEATLAVLPFENQSADAANAFMADGVADDILNGLQRVKGLRVIARTSSFALRDQKLSAQEIGAKLGADVLVQGSVQQQVKDVRVRTWLVDAKTGEQLWSQTFPSTMDDLFALQDKVTAALVAELPRALGVGRLAAPTATRTPVDPETFRNMLEAHDLQARASTLRQVGRQDEANATFARLKAILDAELAKNPNNGDALAMQAGLLIRGQTPVFSVGTPQQNMEACKAILTRVLAADADNVDAATLQAELFSRFDDRWKDAEQLLLRALTVNPNSAETYTQLAYHYAKVGRSVEAIPQAEIAARLDPSSAFRRSTKARLLSGAGRVDEAISLFRSLAFAGEVNFVSARDLFDVLMDKRDLAGMTDVLARLRAAPRLGGLGIGRIFDRMQAVIDGMQGRPEQHRNLAKAFFVQTSPDALWHNEGLWFFTIEAAAMGDIDRALDGFALCIRNEIIYQAQWHPYGHAVPVELAKHPRWMQMWTADPRLKELCDLRLDALKRRQFYGRLPSGEMVKPA